MNYEYSVQSFNLNNDKNDNLINVPALKGC